MIRGADESHRWLGALGLSPTARWYVEISISADADTAFELNIYGEEWGFAFHHGGRGSWIRVTDIPFVHGRDDFQLLPQTPELLAIDTLVSDLERTHGFAFRRVKASIRSNLPDALEIVRDWLVRPRTIAKRSKTIELCGDEMYQGIRCTKARNHDGDHEYRGRDLGGQLRWRK